MVRTGDVLVGRYEILETLDVSHFPGAVESGLQAYYALDEVTQERVVVKLFPIPEDQELANFATALWDREVRTTHLATSSLRGTALLRLLDARRDRRGSRLILVSAAGGRSLAEILSEEPKPGLLLAKHRSSLWEGFLELAKALEALHSAGLIHRNISPQTIYLDESERGPLFRVGDFSWSVYLHSLSRMVSEPSGEAAFVGTGVWSKFAAPEAIAGGSASGESFRSDIFSLGLVIAECMVGPSEPLEGDRQRWIEELRARVRESDSLSQEEKLLILRMLEPNPPGRPTSAEVVDSVRIILSNIGRDLPIQAPGPMTIAFDTRPESRMWKDLERWLDTDGLGSRVNEFLREEFTGARVYPLPQGEGELWIHGRSGTPYRLEPYFNKKERTENLGVGGIWPKPFVPEITTEPILILTEGVKPTKWAWNPPIGPSWAPYFLQARKTKRRDEAKGPRELFVDRLRITLQAERELTARQIYAYRIVTPISTEDRRQVLEVELDTEAASVEFGEIERTPVETWFRTKFSEGRLDVELSDNPSPVARMNPDCRWRIRRVKGGNRLVLERLGVGKQPSPSGWLKPWDLVYLIPLLRRKERAVDLVELDKHLLQSLVEPESVSIFPGPREPGDFASEVLSVRPLYLIQGPPGTGKTYWASRVIANVLKEDETARILVSAQAHKPLDHLMGETRNVVSRLDLDPPPILVRLSRKEELGAEEREDREEDLDLVTQQLLERAAKWTPGIPAWEKIGEEWRTIVAEQLESPSPVWEEIVRGGANIVFLTSTSASLKELEKAPPFDLVIIEEAGKGYATELLPPMRLGRRWLLIGDQQQLPPFQHREMLAAATQRLQKDEEFQRMDDEDRARITGLLNEELRFFGALFSRVQGASYPYKPRGWSPPAARLNDQWRMPPLLSELISTVFYRDRFRIRTPERPLPFRRPEFLATKALVWVDTPYSAGRYRKAEERAAPGGGYFNPFEAEVIDALLAAVGPALQPGLGSLVVLSPYLAQVRLFRGFLKRKYAGVPCFNPAKDIHTVDSFQGRQAAVTVISLVRNNVAEGPLQALGFLTENERMNVLLSRVSHQLIIVGCLELFETFSSAPEAGKLKEVAEFVRSKGMVVDARSLLKDGLV